VVDSATLNSCKAWVAGVHWFLLFIFIWPIYALVNLSAAVPADVFFYDSLKYAVVVAAVQVGLRAPRALDWVSNGPL
jgi:hypothetical protein